MFSIALRISWVAFLVLAAHANFALAQVKPQAEVVSQMGHSDEVHSVAFSPDGRLTLSTSKDNTLRLWEVATGRELRSFLGHLQQEFYTAVFSRDGRFILSGSSGPVGRLDSEGSNYDHVLTLWDRATGKELRSFKGHTHAVSSVAFSHDGRLALSGSLDKTMRLWNVATGQALRTFRGDGGPIQSIALSPDGRLALSGNDNDTMTLWDVTTGEALRVFRGHRHFVMSVAFSPDGRLALSGSWDQTVKLWDVATGKQLRSFEVDTGHVDSVAFSPDGRRVLTGSSNGVKLWDRATGRQLRSFSTDKGVKSVAFSPDGRLALSDDNAFSNPGMTLWDLEGGGAVRRFERRAPEVSSVALSPDGRLALFGEKNVKLWDLTTGRLLRSFGDGGYFVKAVAFSPNGELALSGHGNSTVRLWQVKTGKELRSFRGDKDNVVFTVAFSPDGRLGLSAGSDQIIRLWDISSGRELRRFEGHTYTVTSVAFSPDGAFALSGSWDNTLRLWNVATGQTLWSTKERLASGAIAFSPDGRLVISDSYRALKLRETVTGKEVRQFNGASFKILSVAFSRDGRFILSAGADARLTLWDVESGKELKTFSGHSNHVTSVGFSPNGRFGLSGSKDGTIRLWDIEKGEETARMMATGDNDWLAITKQGFFSGSQRDTDMLAITRGDVATTIGQVHQSLFNPDLLQEALAGDADGEVARAARVLNVDKVLDAGPPPTISITSPEPQSSSDTDLVSVAARVTDRGKGIGRIEWRVNGVTVGVAGVPASAGTAYEVKQALALDPGENNIEVIAYERRNLLASLPARTAITFNGPADTAKPKLHILGIGINAYVDEGWTPPASTEKTRFPPLNLAVADAKAFVGEMRKAGGKLYGDVHVTTALDSGATAANLDKTFEEVASKINPRDTFVLFAAAHGVSKDGRFYLIPQDYQGGNDPEALASRAISQERIQDWVANRIKAKKAIILLDTCESGALVSGYQKSRTDTPASEAAIGRLHEAIGRPVLTAAAAGKPAFEGYKGHGVFTYALMDALHRGDSNGNGFIELSELVTHAQALVPQLSAKLSGGGTDKGIAVVAMRGFNKDKQSAHFGSTGEDFTLVRRLP